MNIFRVICFFVICLISLTPGVAGIILQPIGATTDMGALFTSPDNVINQSGLSVGYTSGVTDFDTYIASSPTHNSTLNSFIWTSDPNDISGNFDFDLGGSFTIESFALWNLGVSFFPAVRGFNLLADDNAAFSSPTTLLFDLNASNSTGQNAFVIPEVFTFAPTVASFVRFQVRSNYGTTVTSFGEVAFEASPSVTVPEPSAKILLLSCFLICVMSCSSTRDFLDSTFSVFRRLG